MMSDFSHYAAPFSGARWVDVLPRSAALPELPVNVLLHAGPPYRGSPPEPVVNAAVQALLYEGLARDEAGARAMLDNGTVQLVPAQSHRMVTPLAQVVSSSMPVLAVRQQGETIFAPVVEGPAPALRFGSSDPRCREKLALFGAWLMETVAPLVRRQPVPLDQVIEIGLAKGDECHARTTAANNALLSFIDGLDAEGGRKLEANPAFVLPLMMAAAATALYTHRSSIDAIGGNGIEFGVRYRGKEHWHRVTAEAPSGTRFASHDTTIALPAIGDSAVIDFCGLGGQALDAAPMLAAEWAPLLAHDISFRRAALLDPASGIADPSLILTSRLPLWINLAILDHGGVAGLIGRGLYTPPAVLFNRL